MVVDVALRSAVTRTATALLMVAAVVATPGSAEARRYVHQDPRGDMYEVSVAPYAHRPEQANGDILRIRVRHLARQIRVRVVLAELQQTPATQIILDVPFWTNEGVFRGVSIIAAPGDWGGMASMVTQRGLRARCAVHHALDYRQNVMALNFSRKCLSNPRWVRLQVETRTAVPDQWGMGWPPIVQDDALRTGVEVLATRTPRIRRG